MKLKLMIIFLLVLSGMILGQLKPFTYKTENNSAEESVSIKSNTILNILARGDSVFLATNKGLSFSFNGGLSWNNTYRTNEFGSEGINAIDFHNGEIWATTAHNVTIEGESLPEGSGIRLSTDMGNTWQVIGQSVDDSGDSSMIYGVNMLRVLPVTVAINNISYDMAVTDNAVWTANFAGGLRKTSDKGVTWQRVVLPPDYLDYITPDSVYSFSLQPVSGGFGNESYLNHRVFSIAAVDKDTLYVGTAGGINKTTDGGKSWTKFNHTNQENPISGNFIVALDYNSFDGSIWAATWKAEGSDEFYAVSSSKDGGKTWQTYLAGIRAHGFAFMNKTNPNSTQVIAATDDGLFLSSPDFKEWTVPVSIYDEDKKFQVLDMQFYSAGVPAVNSDKIWAGSSGDGLAEFTQTGSGWKGNWKSLFVSEPVKSKDDAYAFPNPFAPDEESVRIKYLIPSAGSKVTIRILDFGMNLVRTVIQNSSKSGSTEQIDYWDGKDESGKVVPNGVYFFRIDTDEGDPQFGKVIVLM